jgi:acyl-CoA thioesterase
MYELIYNEPMTAGELPFQLPEWISCAPFEEFLGMRIEEAAGGRAVLTMPFRVKLSQGVGFMHGGAITALADTSVAMAIKSVLPPGTDFVTLEVKLRFLAPVREGILRAEAKVAERDGRKLVGEAEVFSGDVKAAVFSAEFRIRR